MAGKLSQFSDIQLDAVYQCMNLQVNCAAQQETASPPTSTLRLQRLFRSPYILIDAVVDFNRRHSEACVEKLKNLPTAVCGAPWARDSERRLDAAILVAIRSMSRLAIDRWDFPPRHAALLADNASNELRQRIREEYENGRDAHLQAIAALQPAQTPPASCTAGTTTKKKKRSSRKAPIDKILGVLERKARERLRTQFPHPDALHKKMVDELYSLSAENLLDKVNDELESLGIKGVVARTVSRSDKYTSWKKYRRHMASPVNASTDCGPAFTQLGHRTPTAADFADAELVSGGLAVRSRRTQGAGKPSRSEADRAADEWAKNAGVVLPPAD